jgi:membrane associated rhomboid family serine protease
MAVLRKRFEKEAVNDLWRRARGAPRRGELECPVCRMPMVEVGVHRGARETVVDACSFCYLLWFDFDELEMLPEKPALPPPSRLSPQAAEAQALLDISRRDDIEEVDPFSRDALPGWLGLPQKFGAPERSVVPWVTYLLAGALLVLAAVPIVEGWSKNGYRGVGEEIHRWALAWGFIPIEPLRHGGFTSITSFFLHGGLWHVLGNVYFLMLAGVDVEGLLGRGRYLLLLLVSTVTGDVLYAAFAPHSTIPLIGASGGISGLLGWYALAFPQVRVGIILSVPGYGFGRWMWHFPTWYRVRVPVRWMFAFWLALQVAGMLLSDAGIAYGAHLGGALAGVVWWAIDRARTARAAA